MTKHKPETIELAELRQLANKKGKLRKAAQAALTKAEYLKRGHKLGSILLDRELRHIQVYEITGNLHHTAEAA